MGVGIQVGAVRGKTGGTRALCQGRKSYRTLYTFRRRDGVRCTAPLAAWLPA